MSQPYARGPGDGHTGASQAGNAGQHRSGHGAGRGALCGDAEIRECYTMQLLSESAVLGLFGRLAGILLAYWGVRLLSSLLPANFPLVNAIRLDYFVLGFAFLLSIVASFAFAMVPAFFVASSNLIDSLRASGARSGESGGGHGVRSVLAAGEIAIAMVLLLAAGLLLRSFSKLTAVSPGFDAQHILTAEVSWPRFQYANPQQWMAFCDALLTQVQSQPGLKNTAIAIPVPLADGRVNLAFDIVGAPPATSGTSRTADYVSISENYFHVMGVPLLAGRYFDERDSLSSARVTIVSQALARLYFPRDNPLGKQLCSDFRRTQEYRGRLWAWSVMCATWRWAKNPSR